MRLRTARMAVALAAPAGVLAGHSVGYLAVGGHADGHAVDHSYLAVVAALATPLVVAAVLWAAASGARGRRRPLPVAALLASQSVLFAGQEMVEHALAGHGAAAALGSPALWLGLAAQAMTALALSLLLGVAAATGHRAVTASSRLVPVVAGAATWVAPRATRCLPSPAAATVAARGPPLPLV